MIDKFNRFTPRRGVRRAAALATLTSVLTLSLAATALAGPPPVLLRTAGDFAVLGGSGLTNTGTTTIVGDVGSSPTSSQPGFGPCPAARCVILTGTNHNDPDPNDAVTQRAKTDLITAYDDAFGRTGGTAIVAPLGGGQTLVSGVYTSATDIFVGGDLTLDGGGDPNAVFIFQAKTGTLITAAGITSGIPNTRVLLTNGAQACNVFWQVGSSATIETFTQFVGTILALQSITVNTSATLDTGAALARNGAVTLDTNTIKKTTCATPPPGTTPPPGGTPPADGGTPPGSTPPADGGTPPASSTPPVSSTAPAGTAASAPSAAAPASAPLAPTALAAPAMAPLGGTARISGPSGPVGGPFDVTVTGRAIAEVTFFVDGKRIKTVRAAPGRRKFTVRVNPRRQSRGVHRVTARVRFTPRSRTRITTRRVTYRRPGPAPRAPRFTG